MRVEMFIKKLKKHKDYIPRQTLLTIRGQAIAGDLKGAEKGLEKAIAKYYKGR